MAVKKVGDLIKEARTAAGLSQAKLAEAIEGVSAADIGKAERGEKELTQAQLRAIAKATGVTQKSLLEAPKGASKTTAAKTSQTKPSSAKTGTTAKPSSAKTGTTAKTASNTLTLTATEKKLIELYRAADSDTKKAATALLKGETPQGTTGSALLNSLLGGAASLLGKK